MFHYTIGQIRKSPRAPAINQALARSSPALTVQVGFEPMELYPIAICEQMTRALGYDASEGAPRLYDILNDPGSFAQATAFGGKYGTRPAAMRTALSELEKPLMAACNQIEQLDWESLELIAAGYAREQAVFTASDDRISAPGYTQRDADLAGVRRLLASVAFARENLNTDTKSRLGIEKRLTKYMIEAYEKFTGTQLAGERANKRDSDGVRRFLEIGLNHISDGKLTRDQCEYVIRQAAEMHRQPR